MTTIRAGAVAVGEHAGERLRRAPDQVLDRHRQRERLAAPAQVGAHRLQEEAEAVADAHRQGEDQAAADEHGGGRAPVGAASSGGHPAHSRTTARCGGPRESPGGRRPVPHCAGTAGLLRPRLRPARWHSLRPVLAPARPPCASSRAATAAWSRVIAGSNTRSTCQLAATSDGVLPVADREPGEIAGAERRGLEHLGPHDRHAEQVGLELHQQVVRRRAAVDAQLAQREAARPSPSPPARRRSGRRSPPARRGRCAPPVAPRVRPKIAPRA